MPQPFPNNIFLTGFMASGKSTVGPLVAEKLGWTYLDTDARIESQIGMSVERFFSSHGEPAFRALETRLVEELCQGRQAVVSLGGGALLNPQNRQRLFRAGLLVYLRASVPTLLERLEGSERPLLKGYRGDALKKHVQRLLKAREPIYGLAGAQVDTDRRTPAEVAELILRSCEQCQG